MRIFLCLTTLLAALACVSGIIVNQNGVDYEATPLMPGEPIEDYCLLKTISFTNGVSLALPSTFNNKTFAYYLNCPALPLSTVVTPRTMDPGSTSEVWFNANSINVKTSNTAISNNRNVYQAPYDKSFTLNFVPGTNVITVGVSCNGAGMPYPCFYNYTFTCSCSGIHGDPQFVGLRGQNYQVHGVSGEIYNIISDPSVQLNARFVFLDSGKCPVVDGKKQKNCFSHPGSYLGEIGIKTRAGDKVQLVAGSADDGFASIQVNAKDVAIGETVMLAENLGSVSVNGTHMVTVQVGNWNIVYENSDMYVNQQVKVTDASSLKSHGLLGQTWRKTTYNNAIKHIQGQVDDYVIREKDIFGDSFVYNMFN